MSLIDEVEEMIPCINPPCPDSKGMYCNNCALRDDVGLTISDNIISFELARDKPANYPELVAEFRNIPKQNISSWTPENWKHEVDACKDNFEWSKFIFNKIIKGE